MKRKRNPNQFTVDETQTATLIVTEGHLLCHRRTRRLDKTYYYKYPSVRIRMCDREALEPAARVFGVSITRELSKRIKCPQNSFHRTEKECGA